MTIARSGVCDRVRFDFMGFAQKGGAVMSHVRVAASPLALNQVRIDLQQADAVFACDLVVAAMPDALAVMRRDHTQARIELLADAVLSVD